MLLRKVINAIARLLTRLTQRLDKLVQPTQTAGHAKQVRTTPRGNKRSARTTKPQSSPAQPRIQKKPKAAQSTKVASKSTGKKPKPAPTARSRKAAGSSTPTPASKTRQRAK